MRGSVLVPLDGSAFSEQALPLAADLARARRAPLHLVHVHTPVFGVGVPDAYPVGEADTDADARGREEAHLDGLAEQMRESAGVVTHATVLDGAVVEGLNGYAVETDAGLVVMTTHGRGGMGRAWLGSVADGLLRNSHRPLLLLRPAEGEPPPVRLEQIGHILVPLDGSRLAEAVLPEAVALARHASARMTLVRIVPPVALPDAGAFGGAATDPAVLEAQRSEAARYLEEVARRFAGEGIGMGTSASVSWSAAAGVLDTAKEVDADLIAMATHGRGGWQRVALGSVADKVVRGGRTPVLVLRPETSEEEEEEA
jgi:nucleotide-binding universal stress UspA family protein